MNAPPVPWLRRPVNPQRIQFHDYIPDSPETSRSGYLIRSNSKKKTSGGRFSSRRKSPTQSRIVCIPRAIEKQRKTITDHKPFRDISRRLTLEDQEGHDCPVSGAKLIATRQIGNPFPRHEPLAGA
ncbi:hypothetical protein E4U43_006952 [Claviceps pusilla]|uniref:Uncharacterized protein n=1 Tax=Claviceps pusilla TaxID=123648 RepID=A0A9P7NDI9_9HYPO|nr:hypothetical protein E4U43_006952 [Claviceps pusilla]